MQIVVKNDSVSLRSMSTEFVLGFIIVTSHLNEYENLCPDKEIVLTSGSEMSTRHSDTSLHYAGNAVDIRSWSFITTSDKKHRITAEINKALGPDYDFILEGAGTGNEHWHLEWQPKFRKV